MLFSGWKYSCALSIVVALSLISGSAIGQGFGKDIKKSLLVEAPIKFPEASAVVIFDRGTIDIRKHDILRTRHIRLKILTAAGIEDVGERSVWFHKTLDKIKNFRARTYTLDGEKHKVEKNAIFDKESGVFKERTFTFPALEIGCVIEYEYEMVSKRFRYLSPWYFQGDLYTLYSSVTVSIPPGFEYDISYQNVPRSAQTAEKSTLMNFENPNSTIAVYQWSRTDMPPITDEPYMSAMDDYRSSIRFQLLKFENRRNYIVYIKDWATLGNDFQEYADEYLNKKKDIKKLALEITQGLENESDKSEALYDYVSFEIETSDKYVNYYFANETISGLLKNRHGSGEEKNLLLAELHQAVGIECWATLISRRANAKFNPGSPNLRDFDYLIALAKFSNGWKFLDATDELSPYGLLPPQCLTDGGLLINGKQSSLVGLTVLPIKSVRIDTTRIFLDESGAAICSLKCIFTGYYAARYSDYYSKLEAEQFVKERFLDRSGVDYSLESYHCELDSLERFVVTAVFTTDDMTTELDNNVLVKPVCFSFRHNPFESEKRFFPIDFLYPFTYKNVVEYNFYGSPRDFSLPKNIAHKMDGASFYRACALTDSSIFVRTELKIKKPLFGPGRYRDVRGLFDIMQVASEDEVVAIYPESSE